MPLSTLPTVPLIIFGVLEPLALIYAYTVALTNPTQYYLDQSPSTPSLTPSQLPPQALSTTLQLSNVLLLLAALAIICTFTPHRSITRRYLFVVALADWGHVYAVYAALGGEVFWDVRGWNGMVWGNVGVSVLLNVGRWATLAGAFGRGGGGGEK